MKNSCEIHFALAANHYYLPGLKASLVSIIEASKLQNVVFHILSEGLTSEDKHEVVELAHVYNYDREIDFITPDMDMIKRVFDSYKGAYSAFLRLFFGELFPDLEWIIWSDSDVLWFRDPAELWNLRDNTKSLFWGREPPAGREEAKNRFLKWHSGFDESKYSCTGILLMNLRKLRERKISLLALEFVSKWGTPRLVDQDILNEICYDDAQIIDDRWGCYNRNHGHKGGGGYVLHCSGVSMWFKDMIYKGKWPMWVLWFKYYNEKILFKSDFNCCTTLTRVLFTIAGIVYIPDILFVFMRSFLPHSMVDTLSSATYYSWLMRKKLW